jgi:hypothetical protein
MAESITKLLSDDPLRWQLSKNAAKDARERFDLEDQAQRYLEWYEELIGHGVARERGVALALQRQNARTNECSNP